MSKQSIFLTGATGYIGGSLLWRLLSSKDFTVRALVRDPAKARMFKEKFGVDVVVGSLQDTNLLEREAEAADYVIHTADKDDRVPAKALLNGLKKRKEKTGKKGIYIHTSGTGVLADNAAGEYASDKIYDDAKVEDIETLSESVLHRAVDVAVTQADIDGYAKTYIVLPSIVFGIAKNGFTDAGLQNQHSFVVPLLIRASLKRGQGGVIGKGKNLWANVHLEDVVDLFVVLLNKIHENPDAVPHGREGYFFGASGDQSMYDVCKAIAEALHALGKGKSPEPTSFTEEELQANFGGSFLGLNMRCTPTRMRALGWAPTHGPKDFIASIRPETEILVAKASQ